MNKCAETKEHHMCIQIADNLNYKKNSKKEGERNSLP